MFLLLYPLVHRRDLRFNTGTEQVNVEVLIDRGTIRWFAIALREDSDRIEWDIICVTVSPVMLLVICY